MPEEILNRLESEFLGGAAVLWNLTWPTDHGDIHFTSRKLTPTEDTQITPDRTAPQLPNLETKGPDV